MLVNVTQSLQLRIIPVNNPVKGDGYYKAIVSHDHSALVYAGADSAAGKVPKNVGYGMADSPVTAVQAALTDYETKFGALCITDTNNEFGEDMLTDEKE